MSSFHKFESTSGTHYTHALGYGESEDAYFGHYGQNVTIHSIAIRSIDRLDWQVEFRDSDGNIERSHLFSADNDAIAHSVTGTAWNFYTYPVEWRVPIDHDRTGSFTIALRNMSEGKNKAAGSTGAVVVSVTCGW